MILFGILAFDPYIAHQDLHDILAPWQAGTHAIFIDYRNDKKISFTVFEKKTLVSIPIRINRLETNPLQIIIDI